MLSPPPIGKLRTSRVSYSSLNASLEFLGFTPVFSFAWRHAARRAAHYMEHGSGQGQHAVDLGCGTGGLTRALLRCGFSCTAVEWDAWLLQEAGHHVRKAETEGRVEMLLTTNEKTPLAAGSFDLGVNFMGLHRRTDEEQQVLLCELQRLAPMVLLMDWQMPERNLDLPASSLFYSLNRLLSDADIRHKSYSYAQNGSLEGVLYRTKALTVVERFACLGGSLGVALGIWNTMK